MPNDPTLANQPASDPRPASAVSHGAGLAGLAGLVAWTVAALGFGMAGPLAALTGVVATAVPIILWLVFVDRVHRHPTTGIDWSLRRPWDEVRAISLVKLAGLWATWGAIALIYLACHFYWQMPFAFGMACLEVLAPVLVLLSVPYILWLDRRLVEPHDTLWAFGAWLLGRARPDPEELWCHVRAWGVKAFFVPFMLAIVPGGFAAFVTTQTFGIATDPARLANWLIDFMFVVDVAFATGGYLLTLRPLDTHIRSANPFMAAWTAALICYPPFILMEDGGPLDYHAGTADWTHWFANHPLLLAADGALLVGLTAIYAWSTVAFGLRFSNLTNRGILTHGPYALSRHPAYLSKNLFWWASTLPFLTTGTLADAARATAMMAVVSGVYYWRARTEERHLRRDPAYVAYWNWMARRGPVPRVFDMLLGRDRAPVLPDQKRVSA